MSTMTDNVNCPLAPKGLRLHDDEDRIVMMTMQLSHGGADGSGKDSGGIHMLNDDGDSGGGGGF
jgi:hypothetical protein